MSVIYTALILVEWEVSARQGKAKLAGTHDQRAIGRQLGTKYGEVIVNCRRVCSGDQLVGGNWDGAGGVTAIGRGRV